MHKEFLNKIHSKDTFKSVLSAQGNMIPEIQEAIRNNENGKHIQTQMRFDCINRVIKRIKGN